MQILVLYIFHSIFFKPKHSRHKKVVSDYYNHYLVTCKNVILAFFVFFRLFHFLLKTFGFIRNSHLKSGNIFVQELIFLIFFFFEIMRLINRTLSDRYRKYVSIKILTFNLITFTYHRYPAEIHICTYKNNKLNTHKP